MAAILPTSDTIRVIEMIVGACAVSGVDLVTIEVIRQAFTDYEDAAMSFVEI